MLKNSFYLGLPAINNGRLFFENVAWSPSEVGYKLALSVGNRIVIFDLESKMFTWASEANIKPFISLNWQPDGIFAMTVSHLSVSTSGTPIKSFWNFPAYTVHSCYPEKQLKFVDFRTNLPPLHPKDENNVVLFPPNGPLYMVVKNFRRGNSEYFVSPYHQFSAALDIRTTTIWFDELHNTSGLNPEAKYVFAAAPVRQDTYQERYHREKHRQFMLIVTCNGIDEREELLLYTFISESEYECISLQNFLSQELVHRSHEIRDSIGTSLRHLSASEDGTRIMVLRTDCVEFFSIDPSVYNSEKITIAPEQISYTHIQLNETYEHGVISPCGSYAAIYRCSTIHIYSTTNGELIHTLSSKDTVTSVPKFYPHKHIITGTIGSGTVAYHIDFDTLEVKRLPNESLDTLTNSSHHPLEPDSLHYITNGNGKNVSVSYNPHTHEVTLTHCLSDAALKVLSDDYGKPLF